MNQTITQDETGLYHFHSKQPLTFRLGGSINALDLVYECYGNLNSAADNVILIHHALSPDCHVASSATNEKPGWWEDLVGPGKACDTDRYYIICINNIGSPFGSSSPKNIESFPTLTMLDIVESQRVLLQHLGINKLHAIARWVFRV